MPSAEEGHVQLEAALGGALPDGVRALRPEHLDHLAGALTAARASQERALAAAGERSLRFVPRLLRGPVRKVLS
jgi:hypothetical protein